MRKNNKKGAILTRMDGMEFVWKDFSFWRAFHRPWVFPRARFSWEHLGGGFPWKGHALILEGSQFCKNHGSVETKSQTTMIFLYYPWNMIMQEVLGEQVIRPLGGEEWWLIYLQKRSCISYEGGNHVLQRKPSTFWMDSTIYFCVSPTAMIQLHGWPIS